MDQPPGAPWAPLAPAAPTSNRIAVWSWVVALPCALLGAVFGGVGIVRARQRGGAGLTHAVVGLTASTFVLLACLGVLGVLLPGLALVGLSAAAGSADAFRVEDGTTAPLTQQEQDFINGLWDETYFAYDDATLLAMGHGYCDDLDAGATPAAADAALLDRWADEGLGLDAAYDIELTATTSLCPAHADDFSGWSLSHEGPTGLSA